MRSLPLFWTTFLLASAVTVGLGVLTLWQADMPVGLWLRNPIAWVTGAGAAWMVSYSRLPLTWAAPVALVILAATFLGSGQEGVHRWIELGALQVNAAAFILPLAIVSASGKGVKIAALAFVPAAALLAFQPDMSQLAALMAAGLGFAVLSWGTRGLLYTVPLAVAAIAVCAFRPDPLAPVPHVEGIVQLAWQQSPVLAVGLVAGLALTALSPLLLWPVQKLRARAVALTAYFSVSAAACAFGAFPVPLAGYGISFVIGWWLAVGILQGSYRAEQESATFSLHRR